MTAKETAVLEQLRSDLHAYHIEVSKHIVSCNGCRGEVEKLHNDVYGLSGNKDETGLMGDMASTKQTLGTFRAGLCRIWTVILVILGAAATVAIRG